MEQNGEHYSYLSICIVCSVKLHSFGDIVNHLYAYTHQQKSISNASKIPAHIVPIYPSYKIEDEIDLSAEERYQNAIRREVLFDWELEKNVKKYGAAIYNNDESIVKQIQDDLKRIEEMQVD